MDSRPNLSDRWGESLGIYSLNYIAFIIITIMDDGSISVHNFSEKILEHTVHFHVMKLSGGFFLWLGSSPVLNNLAVSMCSKLDCTPVSTLVLGDPSDPSPAALAQRLAKKTQKQVYVSSSLPQTDPTFSLLVEGRINKELQLHPQHF